MRRPSSEVVGTTALVLMLTTIALAVVLTQDPRPESVGTSRPPQGQAASPGRTPSPPGKPRPQPTSNPSADPSSKERPPGPAAASVTASACPRMVEEVPLRVLTLNVHSGYGPTGFDVSRIARLLQDLEVDVALLQEVDRDRAHSRFVDMPGILARETGMDVAFGVNVRQGRSGEYGVATLSRFPITSQHNTHLPNGPGLQQRGVLRTDLDVEGTVVSVFNTHLEHRSKPIRLRQVATMRGLVGRTPHPVVLGGDLNSGPGSPMMRLARTYLRDAWLDAGTGRGATSPAHNPRVRIDYLMYAPPLAVTQVEVLPSVVSDHRGVLARLLLSVSADEVCVPLLDGAIGSGGG